MKTAAATLLMAFLCLVSVEISAQNSNDFESLITTLQDRNSTDILYTVQVGAFKTDFKTGHFRNIEHLFSHNYDDGLTRFYSNLFRSLSDAVAYRNKVRQDGYTDAFTLGIQGGFNRILIDVD